MEDLSYLKSNDTLSFPANDINTCTTFSSDIIYLNNIQITVITTLREMCPKTDWIWTEYRKIRTRKNSVFGHISRSATFNGVIMVGNFLANLVVILCLTKTKQITNPSCKMIFQQSLSDVLAAVTAQLFFSGRLKW